jgi:hypothetical protein
MMLGKNWNDSLEQPWVVGLYHSATPTQRKRPMGLREALQVTSREANLKSRARGAFHHQAPSCHLSDKGGRIPSRPGGRSAASLLIEQEDQRSNAFLQPLFVALTRLEQR